MTPQRTFNLIIRTPDETVFDGDIISLRAPTSTGQVGLRSRAEPTVLAVEAGLVLLKTQDETKFAGTAGGLLRADGRKSHLLTPLAVVGDNVEAVLQQLESLLSESSEEMEARRALGRLETRILSELRQDDASLHPYEP